MFKGFFWLSGLSWSAQVPLWTVKIPELERHRVLKRRKMWEMVVSLVFSLACFPSCSSQGRGGDRGPSLCGMTQSRGNIHTMQCPGVLMDPTLLLICSWQPFPACCSLEFGVFFGSGLTCDTALLHVLFCLLVAASWKPPGASSWYHQSVSP